MPETACKIRRFPLSPDEWTAIVAPCACDYFSIENDTGAAMNRCSDQSDDAATCYQIPAGMGYALVVPRFGPHRFAAGETVTFLKGTGTAIVEFIS